MTYKFDMTQFDTPAVGAQKSVAAQMSLADWAKANSVFIGDEQTFVEGGFTFEVQGTVRVSIPHIYEVSA